jgi:DNA-binding transcriptional regulator YiaG
MYELRALRRAADLGQREFATLLSVPLETLRTWDSGRRAKPEHGSSRRTTACFSGQHACPPPLPAVPDDYDARLRGLRRRLQLTQDALARRIGAAGKAVVHQWESRKRTPSPVLWQRVLDLEGRLAAR